MSVIKSSNIPFKYTKKTGIVSQDVQLELYTEYDTDLKKTFVYQYNFFGSGKPLATIDSSGKISPFEENGVFTAEDSLRNQFATNQSLNNALKTSTRSAVKTELGKTDSNVTNLEIDQFMGTTTSANTAAAPAAAPPTAGQPASPTSQPAAGGAAPGQPIAAYVQDDPIKDSSGVRQSYGNLQYPKSIGLDQDYVAFSMYRYKPKGLGQTTSSTLDNGITVRDDVRDTRGGGKGTVILPIQSPASDSNTVGWGDGRMTGVEAAVFNIAYGGITQGMGEMVNRAGSELESIVKNPTYKNNLGIYFAQQAAQINDAFARATGGILNPNLELLFQSPELRSFNFTFKLSARDEEEATEIRKIIRFFKQGMSVKKAQGTALFLKSPDIFDITYARAGGGLHKSINQFKTCALRAFNVDYTPLGSYMTYDDPAATMVAYTISMQFQEIDPIYDDDYNAFAEDAIGY